VEKKAKKGKNSFKGGIDSGNRWRETEWSGEAIPDGLSGKCTRVGIYRSLTAIFISCLNVL